MEGRKKEGEREKAHILLILPIRIIGVCVGGLESVSSSSSIHRDIVLGPISESLLE